MLSTSSASASRPEARRRCPYRNRRRGACLARFRSMQAKMICVWENVAGRKHPARRKKRSRQPLPTCYDFWSAEETSAVINFDPGLTLHVTPGPLEENKKVCRECSHERNFWPLQCKVTVASFRGRHPFCLHRGQPCIYEHPTTDLDLKSAKLQQRRCQGKLTFCRSLMTSFVGFLVL